MSKKVTMTVQQLLRFYDEQKNQLSGFERIRENIQNKLTEVLIAEDSLKEIKKSEKDNNILLNIGSGIFIQAKLASITEVNAAIGGNAVTKMTIKKALLKLEEKKTELQGELKKIQQEERKLYTNIKNLEKTLIQMRKQKPKDNSKTPLVS